MKDVTGMLPSTEDIIRALGLRSQQTQGSDVLGGLALFGAGILVGAGLALLFTPTTGQELRDEITQRLDDVRQRMSGGESAAGPNGHDAEAPIS